MFEVEIIGNKIRLDGNEYTLGHITCMIASGETGWIKTSVSVITDWKLVQEKAIEYLESCFHSNSITDKTKGYLFCKANYPYPEQKYTVTKKLKEIESDGETKLEITDRYHLEKIIELIDIEMMYAVQNNLSIYKCKNCGKYFATLNAGAVYCNRMFSGIQTCKQFGAKKTFHENLKEDKLLSLYEKTYQAVYYKKRIAKTKKDLKQIDTFIKQLKNSRTDYRKGTISEDQFRSILTQYSAEK